MAAIKSPVYVHDGNEQWHHDQKRDAFLIWSGIHVLRFTNAQILSDVGSVLKTISEYLNSTQADG